MKSDYESQNPSGLFIGSEPVGHDAERMIAKDKHDADGIDDADKGGDDDSTDKADKADSDTVDKGKDGLDSGDADGKD